MSVNFRLVQASKGDVADVATLLGLCGLPAEDIDERLLNGFVVARCSDASLRGLVGVCGVENHGTIGLMRSLAVVPALRDRSLGRTLVEDRLAWSRRAGLNVLYLLTIDAADYFVRFGFRRVERSDLPPEIQATSQCVSLCPATAVAMVRNAAGSSHERPGARPSTDSKPF